MPRVCVVEVPGHPAPGVSGNGLSALEGLIVRTTTAVPDPLEEGEVLLLNSIPNVPNSIPEDRILQFVDGGGGIFSVHDTIYPYASNRAFVAACWVRPAYGAIMRVATPTGMTTQVILAMGDQGDPTSRFPILPVREGLNHPILEGVQPFELAEEAWAQNLAPGVKPLLVADIGDRVFAPERFQKAPMPVAACTTRGQGRLAWFSLGHFAATYGDPNFVRFAGNAVRWVAKETNERAYQWDLFLSYSTKNRDQAAAVLAAAEDLGLTVFQDRKDITYGDIWEEEIRQGLLNSREIALLASPDSLASEWVQTEWGAAWAMGKTITPIALMIPPANLPRDCNSAKR